MPAITDLPIRTERGYEYFSQGTATTTPATYTYPGTMTNYIFRNDGSVNVTLTVNGVATTVASGDCAIGTGMASFTVTASSGTISWTMRAFDLIGVPMLQGGVDQTSALKAYTFQTAATAVGNGTVADVSGYDTLALYFSSTGTASVTFEASLDNTTWIAFFGQTPSTLGQQASVTGTAGLYRFIITGIRYFRARISSYTSGTIDITGFASKGSIPIPVYTSALGNTDGNGATLSLQGNGSYLLGFNGSTWDRIRINQYSQLLASGARTSTTNSNLLTNYNHRGGSFNLNVTAASGTGGLQIAIQGYDQSSASYKTLHTLPTAITAIGLYVVQVYPSIDNVNSAITQTLSQALPQQFRAQIVHGDASSYTYSLSINYIL